MTIIFYSDGFFDALPLAKNANKKHKLNMVGKSKVDREREKLLKTQKQVEKLQKRMESQAMQIKKFENETDSEDDLFMPNVPENH